MNNENKIQEIYQKRIEEAAKKTACPQCVFNDGGTCNNDDDCKLLDDFVGLMTFALQNQWISVEEALPEENELVFGCVNDESTPQAIGMAYYDEYGGWHYSDEEEISLITHWMPIPSLEGSKDE